MDGERGIWRSDADQIQESLGDPKAFGAIFERHGMAIHRYLQRAVSRTAADDLTSEVFVTAFRVRGHYDRRYSDARPWLFGIATNVVRHHFRSERRRRRLIDRLAHGDRPHHVEDPAEAGGRGDEAVATALAQVDGRYREVLLLYAGVHLSYVEISDALSIPVGTVRSRLSRGRAQLRELLTAGGQDMSSIEEETRP
ncbi:MAG TPA: RNA polymerase sigma factor [Acidimicrobiales bacterium]